MGEFAVFLPLFPGLAAKQGLLKTPSKNSK
jgi:hypothetical protein